MGILITMELSIWCVWMVRKTFSNFSKLDEETQSWVSTLHFEVFEKNLHYQGKKGGLYEPREGLVVDLNGDELDDLVFLVHDRLLSQAN